MCCPRKAPVPSLKKKRDFKRVFSRGRHAAGPLFVVYALANDLEITRLGLSVSKKVGGAVVRNRVKRLMRESCRLNAKGEQDVCCRPNAKGGQAAGFRPNAKGGQDAGCRLNAKGEQDVCSRPNAKGGQAAGYDLVIVARAPAGSLPRKGALPEVSKSLARLFDRLKLTP